MSNNSKPRCSKCKSVLVKGVMIEGLARIECGNCGHMNVLAVKKPVRVLNDIKLTECSITPGGYEVGFSISR